VSQAAIPGEWARWVRDVPDHPQPGVLFRDLTPLWADADTWMRAGDVLARHAIGEHGTPPRFVLGVEARGFVVAQALADRYRAGVLLARKPGKLPRAVYRQDYALEYGSATGLELHEDPVPEGATILIADDVLATGGTALAALRLAENLGGSVIGFAFVVEIGGLGGRGPIADYPIASLIRYGDDGATVELR
jgi:adenine phosphoribosyltransferase